MHHRLGTLRIGETSVVLAAASPHRADAFAACRYAIERIKQIAPIWKHEFFAGGDVRGGTVVGASARIGGYPAANTYKPENMAATIYEHLGIPRTAAWKDKLERPHQIYHGEPIVELTRGA